MLNLKKLLTKLAVKVKQHDDKLSGYPTRLSLGTYVYSGASTGTITISDNRVPKASYVIACCQDAGAPVIRCVLSQSQSTITVNLSTAVNTARINYLLLA